MPATRTPSMATRMATRMKMRWCLMPLKSSSRLNTVVIGGLHHSLYQSSSRFASPRHGSILSNYQPCGGGSLSLRPPSSSSSSLVQNTYFPWTSSDIALNLNQSTKHNVLALYLPAWLDGLDGLDGWSLFLYPAFVQQLVVDLAYPLCNPSIHSAASMYHAAWWYKWTREMHWTNGGGRSAQRYYCCGCCSKTTIFNAFQFPLCL